LQDVVAAKLLGAVASRSAGLWGAGLWAGAGGADASLLLVPIIFGIFYFVLILPVQRRQRQAQQMLGALKNGDRVVTTGGIRGTIISLKDDVIQIRVAPDQVRLELLRSAIARREAAE